MSWKSTWFHPSTLHLLDPPSLSLFIYIEYSYSYFFICILWYLFCVLLVLWGWSSELGKSFAPSFCVLVTKSDILHANDTNTWWIRKQRWKKHALCLVSDLLHYSLVIKFSIVGENDIFFIMQCISALICPKSVWKYLKYSEYSTPMGQRGRMCYKRVHIYKASSLYLETK